MVSIGLAAVVDAMDARHAWVVLVEEYPPLADPEPEQAATISESFDIAFPGFAITGEGKKNPHRRIPVEAA